MSLNATRAMELLEEVVKGKEDFVYERINNECLYVHNGECSCIVGHALHRAGYSINDIARLDALDAEGDSIMAMTIGSYMHDVTEAACDVLQAAQNMQDDGRTWGEALEAARTQFDSL